MKEDYRKFLSCTSPETAWGNRFVALADKYPNLFEIQYRKKTRRNGQEVEFVDLYLTLPVELIEL